MKREIDPVDVKRVPDRLERVVKWTPTNRLPRHGNEVKPVIQVLPGFPVGGTRSRPGGD
jgi:hypothetical protein